MATKKVAITLPEQVLERLDRRAAQEGKSRSGLVAEHLDRALRDLEDAEITARYDAAYGDESERDENRQVAEDLLRLAPRDDA